MRKPTRPANTGPAATHPLAFLIGPMLGKAEKPAAKPAVGAMRNPPAKATASPPPSKPKAAASVPPTKPQPNAFRHLQGGERGKAPASPFQHLAAGSSTSAPFAARLAEARGTLDRQSIGEAPEGSLAAAITAARAKASGVPPEAAADTLAGRVAAAQAASAKRSAAKTPAPGSLAARIAAVRKRLGLG